MTIQQVAASHYRSRQALASGAAAAARRLWTQVSPERIVASWRLLIPQVLVVLTGAQVAAARAADGYVSHALAQQGVDPEAVGRVAPLAFSGLASDGRDLDGLLASPAFTALSAIGRGATARLGLASGYAALELTVRTQVADAGRTADQVALTARPQATGYVRMLVGQSCSRCAILAGRRYRWSQGFQRHLSPLRLHSHPGARGLCGRPADQPDRVFQLAEHCRPGPAVHESWRGGHPLWCRCVAGGQRPARHDHCSRQPRHPRVDHPARCDTGAATADAGKHPQPGGYGPGGGPQIAPATRLPELTRAPRHPIREAVPVLIVVSAVEHPDLDDWVREQAQSEANNQGVQLGDYLGREDYLGPDRSPDLCCHIFAVGESQSPPDPIRDRQTPSPDTGETNVRNHNRIHHNE